MSGSAIPINKLTGPASHVKFTFLFPNYTGCSVLACFALNQSLNNGSITPYSDSSSVLNYY